MVRHEVALHDKTLLRLDLRAEGHPVTLRCFLVFKNGEGVEIDRYLAQDLFATTKYAIRENGTRRTLIESLADRELLPVVAEDEGTEDWGTREHSNNS